VQDTFVIAASRLAGLRDPDRLKPWLYAMARNECYRKSRGRAKTTGLAEAGDISGERPAGLPDPADHKSRLAGG
jgi:DNA-directed RNA polymerase specialized sigma24 family protein